MGAGESHKTSEGRLYVRGPRRDERYYIHPDGSRSTTTPTASQPTTYRFDPADPVPTLGGKVFSDGALMPRGTRERTRSLG